ncbi:PepSY domain-containing protein [Burkholderia territorii]|uniref:PepSY domain-containing protein n=1 Tax=Burkholderia territorii TaxID=1503055 RepID=UPI0009BEBFA0|nr:PepSY domain-containing protein [Burkholderia territorii]
MPFVRCTARFWTVSVTLLAFSSSGVAKMQVSSESTRKAGLVRMVVSTPPIDKVDRQQRADDVVTMLAVPDFAGAPGEPVVVARSFIAERALQLGLTKEQVASLATVSQRDEPEFSVVRFVQTMNGIPVHGSDVAVVVSKAGRVIYLANQTVAGVSGTLPKNWSVDRQQAIDRVRAYLGASVLDVTSERQMAMVDERGTRGAWEVRVVEREGDGSEWELLVDATNGEILRSEDRSLRRRGRGLVFNPDPLSIGRHTYGAPGLSDNSDANSAQLSFVQVSAVFPVSEYGGRFRLAGPYAVCADFEPPYDRSCPQASQPALDFSRAHVSFEAVNAYYHLTSYLDYVNKTLGIHATPYQYPGGVQFDPHGLNGGDNSHYVSATGRIAFGQGGVDDAEDADVVIHELGHALHDWLTRGRLSNIEGLSEGLGDYLAAGYSRDMKQWSPADNQYHWVMNWDGHNEYWRGRVTNWHVGRTYPADVRRASTHDAGQYWASCNLAARDVIGGAAMDRAVLKGLMMTNAHSNQRAAAQAVIIAAAQMEYPAKHIDAIAQAYNTTCSYNVAVPTVGARRSHFLGVN